MVDMLIYLAFPRSLTFETANSLQTYGTLRGLSKRLENRITAILPKQRRQPSLYDDLQCVRYITGITRYKPRRSTTRGWLSYLQRSLFAIRAILMATRSYDEPLFYVRDPVLAFWCFVASRIVALKYIVELHQFESANPNRPAGRFIEAIIRHTEPAILRRATKVVTLTSVFADYVAERFGIREIAVVPDAHPGDLSCSHRVPILPDKNTVVYAGLTFGQRRVDMLIQAFESVRSACANATLIVVGGQHDELRFFRSRYTDSAITFTGRMPQCCVQRILSAAGVLAIPGVIDPLSSSPLKLFEYMLAGRPIVCPDLPSVREILDGHSAYFFAPDNPSDMADKIITALCDRSWTAAADIAKAASFTFDARADRIITKILGLI